MKKIIFIIVIFFTIFSCKAQTIILVEDFENYDRELPDNVYVKDVNNLLDKYVGVWKGTYLNKNYEFRIIKITDNDIKLQYKEDKLLIRYKITDNVRNELVNTLNLPNDNKYIINGKYLANSGGYLLNYLGLKGECGQNGDVYISIYDTNNIKMKLYLQVDGEIYLNCTTGAVEQILPTSWIDLTKQ